MPVSLAQQARWQMPVSLAQQAQRPMHPQAQQVPPNPCGGAAPGRARSGRPHRPVWLARPTRPARAGANPDARLCPRPAARQRAWPAFGAAARQRRPAATAGRPWRPTRQQRPRLQARLVAQRAARRAARRSAAGRPGRPRRPARAARRRRSGRQNRCRGRSSGWRFAVRSAAARRARPARGGRWRPSRGGPGRTRLARRVCRP